MMITVSRKMNYHEEGTREAIYLTASVDVIWPNLNNIEFLQSEERMSHFQLLKIQLHRAYSYFL